MTVIANQDVWEDVWIPSACNMCYGTCAIRARRVNGVVVKLEGLPGSPNGDRLCGKGVAGLMHHYDPARITKPLKRTNLEKGIGVDPKWVEISWEEALQTITEKFKECYEKEPRALFSQNTTSASGFPMMTWHQAFGSPNHSVAGGGLHCGNAAHLLGGIYHASWSLLPDFQRCNFAIYFGCSKGHSAGHGANGCAQQAADARARGMRLVVVDPMVNYASAKANEWVPIRPGTDAAMALSMVDQLLNELDLYDQPYLKKFTNGPYLIKSDGLYMRHKENGEPLVWDAVDNCAKAYNDPSVKDFALEGRYMVDGVTCATAFTLIKEHVRKYTPELAEEITGVPAATIRRLAKEFGENARIGSTIMIDGEEFPYRPVAAVFFRGSQGHVGGTNTCIAIELLNEVVGCSDNVGGALGFNPVRFPYPETGKCGYVPKAGPDGLMIPGMWVEPAHLPYPPHNVREPESMGLQEIFPLGMMTTIQHSDDQEELWTKAGLPYRPMVMMNYGCNQIMSVGNPATVAETLKNIPFIMSFDIYLNEFSDFVDIVLPDRLYLEKYYPTVVMGIFNHTAGEGHWAWSVRTPVIENSPVDREYMDVLLELADRIGFLEDYYAHMDLAYDLRGEYRLDPKARYTWPEICDRILKSNFGPEHGLEWFREHGEIHWPKTAREVYWRSWVPVRVPIYPEFFKSSGLQVKDAIERYDISLDLRQYEPLPDWYPCPSHKETKPEFDLYGFYYRDTLHTNSFTMQNPWIDEASNQNPTTYRVALNADTGKKKGLKDGDLVWIESPYGRKVKGQAALIEGIRPDCVGFAACAGHWTEHQPIAKGKGIFYNELLEIDLDHTDPVSGGLDICVKLKVYKA